MINSFSQNKLDTVCADYGFSQHNLAFRRCRFIAHIADLSAFGSFHEIPLKKLISITHLVDHHQEWISQ